MGNLENRQPQPDSAPGGSLRAQAVEIVRRLQQAGFPAYWVGGSVRDYLLGREPDDYDIVTAALPEEIEKLFPHTVAVGRKFGVVVVIERVRRGAAADTLSPPERGEGRGEGIRDSNPLTSSPQPSPPFGEERENTAAFIEQEFQFQVATFRAEADYADGRHPEHVAFGDALADARRRDFTVNGLFYDPIAERLHDWVDGEKDLRAGIIRTIGSPAERFAEDHLRLLRAVRLAAQLDFRIEEETFAALKSAAPKIKAISAERIRDELNRLFRPPHAARGLDLLRESGLLDQVLPEIAATVACHQSPDFHPEGSVFEHLRLMLGQMPPQADPALPWAVLLHDVAKPVTASSDPETGSIHFYGHEKVGAVMAGEILERLRFPRKQIDEVMQAVLHHMQFKDVLSMRKATLRRLLLRPTLPLELELHRLDCLGSHGRLDVHDFLVEQAKVLEQQPEIRPPLLSGEDLMALGMKPGPAMGAMLAEIREKQLQDELKTPDEACQWAKEKLAI